MEDPGFDLTAARRRSTPAANAAVAAAAAAAAASKRKRLRLTKQAETFDETRVPTAVPIIVHKVNGDCRTSSFVPGGDPSSFFQSRAYTNSPSESPSRRPLLRPVASVDSGASSGSDGGASSTYFYRPVPTPKMPLTTRPQCNAVASIIKEEKTNGIQRASDSEPDEEEEEKSGITKKQKRTSLLDKGISLDGPHLDSSEIKMMLGENPSGGDRGREWRSEREVSFRRPEDEELEEKRKKRKGRRKNRSSGEICEHYDLTSDNLVGFADILYMETKRELRVRM